MLGRLKLVGRAMRVVALSPLILERANLGRHFNLSVTGGTGCDVSFGRGGVRPSVLQCSRATHFTPGPRSIQQCRERDGRIQYITTDKLSAFLFIYILGVYYPHAQCIRWFIYTCIPPMKNTHTYTVCHSCLKVRACRIHLPQIGSVLLFVCFFVCVFCCTLARTEYKWIYLRSGQCTLRPWCAHNIRLRYLVCCVYGCVYVLVCVWVCLERPALLQLRNICTAERQEMLFSSGNCNWYTWHLYKYFIRIYI